MKLIKTIARHIVFPFITGIRVDKLFLSRSTKKSLIINFHGVTDVIGSRFNNRHMDVRDFEKTIIYLKKNFVIVPLPELFSIQAQNKKLDKKTIALTFDDGYINNFTQALPVLKKHNVPATFYLISKGLQETDYYVWPDIVDLIQRELKEDITIDAGTFKFPGFYCEKLNLSIVDFLKSAGTKREKYISELSAKYPFYKKIAKEIPQLIELVRQSEFGKYVNEPLIEYGSHTHTHYNLEHLTDTECKEELMLSKKIIEAATGKEVISLAFPDGSYSKNTPDIAFSLGYKNLVAVEYKINEDNSVKGLLSRFTISNSTTVESNMLRLAMHYDKYAF